MISENKLLRYSKKYFSFVTILFFVSTAIGSEPASKTSTENLERQLFEARIRSLPPEKDNKSEELKKIIQQVRSLNFPSRSASQVSSSLQTEENTSIQPKTDESQQSIKAQSYSQKQSEETIKELEKNIKDPNQIRNPYELAEVLYKNGNQVYAGLCYKQAFSKLPANDPNFASQRSWILFQIGNCLKDEDPNTAKESYAELIRTHSDSPWTELAKVRYSLIEWYQQEKPESLMQQKNKAAGDSK